MSLTFFAVSWKAFFVAAEFSIVMVRASRIHEMVSSRLPGSHLASEIVANLDQYLSACQLGVTMVSLGLGWVGGEAFSGLLRPLFLHLAAFAATAAPTVAAGLAFALIPALPILQGSLAPQRGAPR